MVYAREKMADKDALCPINVIFWTKKLRPTSVDLIFLRPQCCKPQILEDLTNIVIISPTFTL